MVNVRLISKHDAIDSIVWQDSNPFRLGWRGKGGIDVVAVCVMVQIVLLKSDKILSILTIYSMR